MAETTSMKSWNRMSLDERRGEARNYKSIMTMLKFAEVTHTAAFCLDYPRALNWPKVEPLVTNQKLWDGEKNYDKKSCPMYNYPLVGADRQKSTLSDRRCDDEENLVDWDTALIRSENSGVLDVDGTWCSTKRETTPPSRKTVEAPASEFDALQTEIRQSMLEEVRAKCLKFHGPDHVEVCALKVSEAVVRRIAMNVGRTLNTCKTVMLGGFHARSTKLPYDYLDDRRNCLRGDYLTVALATTIEHQNGYITDRVLLQTNERLDNVFRNNQKQYKKRKRYPCISAETEVRAKLKAKAARKQHTIDPIDPE